MLVLDATKPTQNLLLGLVSIDSWSFDTLVQVIQRCSEIAYVWYKSNQSDENTSIIHLIIAFSSFQVTSTRVRLQLDELMRT